MVKAERSEDQADQREHIQIRSQIHRDIEINSTIVKTRGTLSVHSVAKYRIHIALKVFIVYLFIYLFMASHCYVKNVAMLMAKMQ